MFVLSSINHYYQPKPCPNSRSAAFSSPEMTSQISERTQQKSGVLHLLMWGILVKTRPLQKNVNAVHARATVRKNFSSDSTICKRRTCVVPSSWMCVDMVSFRLYLFIYLMLKKMYGLFLLFPSRIDRQFSNAWKARTSRLFSRFWVRHKISVISINL